MTSKGGLKWLTTRDLENFIITFADSKTKAAFLGIFAIDNLPQTIPHLPVLFIVNTNTSNLPGQHWKAVYVSTKRIGEVFDSLAMPVSLRLEQWMNRFTQKWSLSKLTLQNPLSPTCGGYVLYYILTRLKCSSMKFCLLPFSSNVLFNDVILEEVLMKVVNE